MKEMKRKKEVKKPKKHMDEKADKMLVKKMVKSGCMK
jgi:hypothetical protein